MKTKAFKFEMGMIVVLTMSGEFGKVIGRAQYDASESTYFVRYLAKDGRQVEAWQQESAIRAKVRASL